MKKAIATLGHRKTKSIIKKVEKESRIPNHLHIDYIFKAICNDSGLAPDITLLPGCENLSDEERIKKWVNGFFDAYNTCHDRCLIKETQTIPDKALEVLLGAFYEWTNDELQNAINAHRIAMSSENIIGYILELFLAEKLKKYGWVMAWGNTVAHVDFCSKNGKMLQIKNRYNSENSSSRKVREKHKIDLWYRIKSSGKDNWEKLYKIIGNQASITSELNEDKFLQYIKELTTKIKDEKKKKAKE